MEIHYKAIVILVVALHSSVGIPFPNESSSVSPSPVRSNVRGAEPQRPRGEPLYLPYSPQDIHKIFSEGRLAAAAVHNVNLRELFKPLLTATDSTRLTNYIDSVINKFNMRSKKPPSHDEENPEMKEDFEAPKSVFKYDNPEDKRSSKPKPDLFPKPMTKNNFKENIFNKTDSLLEKLGIITEKKDEIRKSLNPATKNHFQTTTEASLDNTITVYPHEIYSNLKKLHDSATKSGKTNEQNNGSTKSALFEIEIPFYYPEARMPSFKHIAGATALGALALGAIFASPLGTGLLRRYDQDAKEEEENWLDSLSFWKNDNSTYGKAEGYDVYNTFQDLYSPYYPSTEDVYSDTYDTEKYYRDEDNYGTYYDENNNNDNNNNNYYYQESKSSYDDQGDYTSSWYNNYNHDYNTHPYQYVIPTQTVSPPSYNYKHASSYPQKPFDSKVRAALSVPTSYNSPETQTFNVGDSYFVDDRSSTAFTNRRRGHYPYYSQNYETVDDGNRYVTVEEVNKIAEESLKQILKNYKVHLQKGLEDELTGPKIEPSTYSEFTSADYQSDWEPKSTISEAHAYPLVSLKGATDVKESGHSSEPVKEENTHKITRRRPTTPSRRRKLTRVKDKGERVNGTRSKGENSSRKRNIRAQSDGESKKYAQKLKLESRTGKESIAL